MARELLQTPALYQEWCDLRGDGSQYFLSTWYPTEGEGDRRVQPKAAVVFVHGFAEFAERYDPPFRYFAKRGYEVNGFDQRGYGRTWYYQPEPNKTHGWTSWKDQITDVSHMVNLVRTRLDAEWGKDRVPIFLMGHSMGGGISAGFFTRDSGEGPSEEVLRRVSGVMLSAPWLEIHFPLSLAVRASAMKAVLSFFPRIRIPLGPAAKELSRDPEVIATIRREPMHNNYVYTRGLYDPMVLAPEVVERKYVNWPQRVPLLIVHGTGDLVTRADYSERLVERLKGRGCDAEYVPFEGYYHELLFEPGEDKIKVADAFISWLDRHT